MFDGMLPWENAEQALVATGRDGIDALPDSILERILDFLPAKDAVRTCVLARRWRHLWKWTTALQIVCDEELGSLDNNVKFVDNLLCARGVMPLERCELTFGALFEADIVPLAEWIEHILLCEVQILRMDNTCRDFFELQELSLVSRNLVRLEVIGMTLNTGFCDFSGCPSLEYLEFGYCDFAFIQDLSSESLKCLSITSCNFGGSTLIHAPRLFSLRLDNHWCTAPCFQTVPSLHEAFVRFTGECDYCCLDDESVYCNRMDCFACDKSAHDSCKGLNLDVLSESKNLSWIVESKLFIQFLTRDLKKFRTFTKLKTLLLNEQWCVAPGFHALTRILKHSPVLEKLTLQLFCTGDKHKYRMKSIRNPMDMLCPISEHLKVVEFKCIVIDKFTRMVLKFLWTMNFRRFSLEKVEILEDWKLGTVMPSFRQRRQRTDSILVLLDHRTDLSGGVICLLSTSFLSIYPPVQFFHLN